MTHFVAGDCFVDDLIMCKIYGDGKFTAKEIKEKTNIPINKIYQFEREGKIRLKKNAFVSDKDFIRIVKKLATNRITSCTEIKNHCGYKVVTPVIIKLEKYKEELKDYLPNIQKVATKNLKIVNAIKKDVSDTDILMIHNIDSTKLKRLKKVYKKELPHNFVFNDYIIEVFLYDKDIAEYKENICIDKKLLGTLHIKSNCSDYDCLRLAMKIVSHYKTLHDVTQEQFPEFVTEILKKLYNVKKLKINTRS